MEILAVADDPSDVVSNTASSLAEANGGEVVSMILILDDTIIGDAITVEERIIEDPKKRDNFIYLLLFMEQRAERLLISIYIE